MNGCKWSGRVGVMVASMLLQGCFHAPVLQGARVLPEGVARYDLAMAAATESAFRWAESPVEENAEPARSWEDYPLGARYRSALWLPAFGVAFRHGLGGDVLPAQVHGGLWGGGVMTFGAKFQFVDAGAFSMAFGADMQLNWLLLMLASLHDDDDRIDNDSEPNAAFGLTLPLYASLEVAPWLEFYAVERMQFWIPHTAMPGALLLQTGGLKLGETFGVTLEGTFAYSPAFDDLVPQVAISLFYLD